jgi:hypothetical protein
MFDKLKLLFSPLTKEERKLLKKIKSATINKKVYTYYKNSIKNNENDTKEQARKKLIRNIVLAKKVDKIENGNKNLFLFGNLNILYLEKTNEIVWLENKIGSFHFRVNHRKKNWLNKYLGIEM